MSRVAASVIGWCCALVVLCTAAEAKQQYDQGVMEKALVYSFATYQRNGTYSSIPTWTCTGCCSKVPKPEKVSPFLDEASSTFGFVAVPAEKSLGDLVVAFRGSMDLENWIEDLSANLTVWPNTTGIGAKAAIGDPCTNTDERICVHRGFFFTYLKVKDKILQLLAAASLPSTAKVFITGHSLGGGLAQIAALDIQQIFPSLEVSTYSFGTPRTGNQKWSEFFGSVIRGDFWRVVHWADVVPHLPPAWTGFYHTSNEAWYNKNFTLGTEHICYEAQSPDCSYPILNRDIPAHLCYNHMLNHDCTYCLL